MARKPWLCGRGFLICTINKLQAFVRKQPELRLFLSSHILTKVLWLHYIKPCDNYVILNLFFAA